MDNLPLVSVLIPAYNHDKYVADTIYSIINQTYKNIEIILIDDCSSDNSKAVIEPFLSANVKYICEPKNHGGPAGPRNTGIKQSSGELIMMFDSDDIMLPGKVEKSVSCMVSNTNVGLLCTGFQSIDNNNQLLNENYLSEYQQFRAVFVPVPVPVPVPANSRANRIESTKAYNELFYSNFVGTSSVVIPKAVFEDVGYFDDSLTNGDDRDMWYRIAKKYDFVFIDEILHQYRINEGGISARGGGNAKNRIKVLEKQNTPDLSLSLKEQLNKLLSVNFMALARYNIDTKNSVDARKHILKSWSLKPSVSALKLFIKSFL